MCFHFYYGMTYIYYIFYFFSLQKRKKVNRVKWTSKEFEEIEKYLGHKIREKKNPNMQDAVKAINLSRKNNGQLKRRHWHTLVKKVSYMIHNQNKTQGSNAHL